MMLDKTRCATCDKGKGIWKCEGCLQTFCSTHMMDHRQDLNRQMEDVEDTRNLIRQMLTERVNDFKNHSAVQAINEWEDKSIKAIRQTAQEAREAALKNTAGRIAGLEMKLAKLTEELRQSRQENDYFETDLRRWKASLAQLEEDLHSKLGDTQLRDDPKPLMFKASLNTHGKFDIDT
jgi:DNA repair exonuclease SbcCD ATPase subunit